MADGELKDGTTKEKEIKEWFPWIVATHRERAKMAPTKGGIGGGLELRGKKRHSWALARDRRRTV